MRNLRATLFSLAVFAAAPGCDGDKNADDSSGAAYWCESMGDADSYYIEEGGGNATSGKVTGRVITDVTGDLHDEQLVSAVDYTLNPASGGSASLGETDDYGEFTKTLGEGTWTFQFSHSSGGYSCQASFEFPVVAGKTTYLCLDAHCG